ncbi:MAG: cob(I)yrinic acid a,c-diamide adenosyltransferase [Anaerolineae bacterium]|nr:cob(I)yrinic acid a,c-diamide adenosyltransferase [Anaerolineae bacterium]
MGTITPMNSHNRTADRGARRKSKKKKGLVIVNTGEGKGKTTAALGLALRAWGHGMRVLIVQFLKHQKSNFGETRAARKIGIEMIAVGDGFTWTSRDMDETIACNRQGWDLAREYIAGGEYDVVILDEFTYLLDYGWLDTDQVIDWLRENKPPMLHLVITGRDAPAGLVDYADLVSEVKAIKHPYDQQEIEAQKGVEF